LHYGIVNDPKPGDNFVFGKKTAVSDHVPNVVKYPEMSKLAEYNNDLNEAKYGSHKREPLGKPMPRNYEFPEEVKKEDFKFGVKVVDSESAKVVLFPENGEKHESPEVQAMYLKTHGNYEPGQQKERGYKWPVDKSNFRFGYQENDREENGAAKCVQPERFGDVFPKTTIVQKTVEDYIEVTKDELGKVKNLGQSGDPNMAFGAKVKKGGEEWNAALCIHGDPSSAQEVAPDKDLGKCAKANCTNTVRKPGDENRVFGVPTVRNDIPRKDKRSVADHQNYGDEPGACELLFPSNYLEFGVSEADFNASREKDEIKMIFENIGFKYKIGKFNAIYSKAQEYSKNGEVSVRTFLEAVKELHFVE